MEKTILGFVILCACLQITLIILGVLAWQVINSLLTSVMMNQVQLATRVSARQNTARMATGMPREDLPPAVEQERRIGVARRSRRIVAGGDPQSEQYSHLQRGLPKLPEEDET